MTRDRLPRGASTAGWARMHSMCAMTRVRRRLLLARRLLGGSWMRSIPAASSLTQNDHRRAMAARKAYFTRLA